MSRENVEVVRNSVGESPSRMRLGSVGLALFALALAGCGGDDKNVEVDGVIRQASESMRPTYNAGDRVEIDKDPESVGVGDVVLFHPPVGADLNRCGVGHTDNQACPEPTDEEAELLFMKRIVGKPGDRLSIRRGRVYIAGAALDEDYTLPSADCATCNLEKEITIPEGYLFVVGDNRGESADSREWGPIRSEWITAKVVGVRSRADDDGEGPEIE
jgi:signal peptidase I